MEDFQNNSNSSRGPELVIQDTLQTSFAKPPSYGKNLETPPVKSGRSGKMILKFLFSLLIFAPVIIGGYFAFNNYFPQYAKYIQPYLGPVIDPVLGKIQPVLDKVGLAKPITPSPSSQPSPSATAGTAGWKTYRNFEYGFEFKYPENLTLRHNELGLQLGIERVDLYQIESNGDIPFNFSVDARKKDTDQTCEQYLIDSFGPRANVSVVKISLRGYSADRVSGSPAKDTFMSRICFDKEGLRFYIGFSESQLGNQILSTFIFPPDADGDGLPDKEESKYGTNPNNPDTDGDSWPDGEEVQNGYNPLGPGKAK